MPSLIAQLIKRGQRTQRLELLARAEYISKREQTKRLLRCLSSPPHFGCSGRPRALAECPGRTSSRGESVVSS